MASFTQHVLDQHSRNCENFQASGHTMCVSHCLIDNDVGENGTSRDGTTMANTIAACVLQGHQNLCAEFLQRPLLTSIFIVDSVSLSVKWRIETSLPYLLRLLQRNKVQKL